jgi:hypothetical protein
MQQSYLSEEIMIATDGCVDKRRLQNWHARGLWLTKTKSPDAGKPYCYSHANFCEAVICAVLTRHGYTDESARGVIKHRLRQAFRKGRGGWEVDYISRFGELPELGGGEAYWVIFVQSNHERWGQIASRVIGCKSIDEVAAAVKGGLYVGVFDVGQVISGANQLLSEARRI